MDFIIDFFHDVVLEFILTFLTPEGVARKVVDEKTSKAAKITYVVLFSIVYILAIMLSAYAYISLTDTLFRSFMGIISFLLLMFLLRFYYKIIKHYE